MRGGRSWRGPSSQPSCEPVAVEPPLEPMQRDHQRLTQARSGLKMHSPAAERPRSGSESPPPAPATPKRRGTGERCAEADTQRQDPSA
jgi:hypothetical protein